LSSKVKKKKKGKKAHGLQKIIISNAHQPGKGLSNTRRQSGERRGNEKGNRGALVIKRTKKKRNWGDLSSGAFPTGGRGQKVELGS